MNTILIIGYIMLTLIGWLFSTSLTVNGRHGIEAFIAKSLFFAISVALSMAMGYFAGKASI